MQYLFGVVVWLIPLTSGVSSSSCLALNDLIRGRQAEDLIEYLAEIWETLFRVLDDIKVRLLQLAFFCMPCLFYIFSVTVDY